MVYLRWDCQSPAARHPNEDRRNTKAGAGLLPHSCAEDEKRHPTPITAIHCNNWQSFNGALPPPTLPLDAHLVP